MEESNLKIIKKAEEIRKLYNESPHKDAFNLLLLGESGSGKSYFLRTCRKPVLIDSFDPGGAKCLRDFISDGSIIADTRWEEEDPKRPSVFALWQKEMAERTRMNFWDHVGTYVIDSATMWSESIMNWVQAASGRAGEAPKFTKDYVPQKVQIRNWIRAIMKDVKGDFILIGHLRAVEDQVSGQVHYRFMTTGQGMVVIPLLFEEIWVADPRKIAKGVDYRFLTQSTGIHVARSRLAKGGMLETYEEPDMKKILKKVGMNYEDKPLLKGV